MIQYYYVKANRQTEGFDWDTDKLPLGKTQWFSTHTRNRLYWKSLRKGDIIIGHSSYISSFIKGKQKFTPLPRISAIAIVEKEEHYNGQRGQEEVILKKLIELYPVRITKDKLNKQGLLNLKNDIKTAEPFRLGTNRCTITRLNEDEFEKIIKLIQDENSNIRNEIKKYLYIEK